jgi:hypothetical protein
MLNKYLKDLQLRKAQNGSEYSYRADLRQILKGLSITDEPKGKKKDKVDMEVFTPEGLVAFYIETKDLGEDLSHKKHQDQFNRYKSAYKKLVITNFLDFEFYRDGALLGKCTLADLKSFTGSQADFDQYNNFIDDFKNDCIQFTNPILLAKKLAEKTKFLKNEIFTTLEKDDAEIASGSKKNFKLVAYRNEFKKMLLNDIDNDQFADLYAQTITYGLFASRYYSFQKDSKATFKRSDASDLIPNTNPLLKQFFDSISRDSKSSSLGKNITIHLDGITTILANADMTQIIQNLKLANNDIVIHFYETFLEHYDPELRASMGVWYTPVEVVDYIVKGVDSILKSKFNIEDGISSSETQDFSFIRKTKVKGGEKTEKVTKEKVHKVQILDPATGTGNFLNSTINYIRNNFEHPILWDEYVNNHLIPRLNGFELMMPSYVMAHMKMYELLKDSLDDNGSNRFNVYLTNTLNGGVVLEEENVLSVSDLIHQLNEEALGANRVRQEQPVMVIMGNPPYNGASTNQGDFINGLMSDYSFKGSSGALNDDYIKFIRYGQHLIDQNGSGVLAYISNNSFLKSIALQNMRKSLLESFDEIYTLDFTFDSKWNQENVKDRIFTTVKTPVCISFFVKTGIKKAKELGKVFYTEVKGDRQYKFDYLNQNTLNGDFKEISLIKPEYYFYPQDANIHDSYNKNSFSLDSIFKFKSTGILTKCDNLVIDSNLDRLKNKVSNYLLKGDLPKKVSGTVKQRGKGVTSLSNGKLRNICYRPFDNRHYFDSTLSDTRVKKLVDNEQAKNQIFLWYKSSCWDNSVFSHILLTKEVPEYGSFAHGATYSSPLYQYHEADVTHADPYQTSNFTQDFLDQISLKIGKLFNDNPTDDTTFSSLDAMDYIYGYLNDKSYTTTYNQFLKSNYPKVPFPTDLNHFETYRLKGETLRTIHLDDSTKDPTSNFIAKSNTISKVSFDPTDNKLYFNKTSYFDNISNDMWNFKIGASQPLKNWLEARKDDDLTKSSVDEFKNVIYKVRNSI